ncbi:MAG: hypothetical protein HYR96_08625 [Deltaproteobacteria bacterium]|nr:hypothetical protein [Deltaproteobacteria bacterium]MBI3294675.1 hypothetical protein [Deltaproteobacteria bacterium]
MFPLLSATLILTALNWGVFDDTQLAIPLLTASAIMAGIGLFKNTPVPPPLGRLWALVMALSCAIPYYLHGPIGPFKKVITIALTLTVLSTIWRRYTIQIVIAVSGIVLISFIYLQLPPPQFDLWYLQENAIALLGKGKSPYGLTYYAKVPLIDTWVTSLPYPPAHLIAMMVGTYLGDFRWAFVIALIGSALVLYHMAKKSSEPWVSAIPFLFLFYPKAMVYIWRSWTEPTLVGAIALSLWALNHKYKRLLILALGVVFSIKQFGFLFVLALLIARQITWRDCLSAALIAAAICLPFLIADPMGVLSGVILTHLHTPPRPDSISLPALIRRLGGPQFPAVTGFLSVAVVAALATRLKSFTLSTALLLAGILFLVFFLMSPKAHENYYFTPLFLLVAAAVAFPLGATPRRV